MKINKYLLKKIYYNKNILLIFCDWIHKGEWYESHLFFKWNDIFFNIINAAWYFYVHDIS